MFKKFFGGMQNGKPPDRKTMAKWLCGNWDARQVQNLLQGLQVAFLEQMDAERIVERHASANDLSGDGGELIKGKIIRMMTGPAPGYVEKPLRHRNLPSLKKFMMRLG